MENLNLTLTGIAPLCFHNERLVDPANPYTREIKRLSAGGSKNKTDEILQELRWLEWRGGFYDDPRGIPLVSSDMVLASGRDGARKLKKGKQFDACAFCQDAHFVLKYDGPKTIEELKGLEEFSDYRGVKVGQAKVMRSRPCFQEWSLDVSIQFDPDVLDRDTLIECFDRAGQMVGMGERRPRWGRYTVEVRA